MNITFVGGGSLRLTPIIRGMLQVPGLLNGGSIRLADRILDRAETVSRAVQACPEFRAADCRILHTDDLDRALDGTDALYVTMAIERQPSRHQATAASVQHRFLCSDQLSINGAFLAARGGPAILSFARKMEQYCPRAIMLIFANPVPVFSAIVNNHMSVRALGICAGFTNHQWDLPRLCGRNECDRTIDVVAAGVNHLSFILRGTWQGRDVFEVLREHVTPDWTPPDMSATCPYWDRVRPGLEKLAQLLHRYGTTIFSSEGDGLNHLFPEAGLAAQRQAFTPPAAPDLAQLARRAKTKIDRRFLDFRRQLEQADAATWQAPFSANPLFGANQADLAIPILSALAGLGRFKIAASAPNHGAVEGFSDRAVLEYTMNIDKDQITPMPRQYIPAPFYGLVASMSEFQTLQADAIATADPRLFANALEAYPLKRFTAQRREYIHEMFDIYDDIPASLKAARNMVRG